MPKLMEILSNVLPEHRTNWNRELAKQHFEEITQARLKGYSWYQITDAIKTSLTEEQKQVFSADQIERYYRRIKSDAKKEKVGMQNEQKAT